MKKLMLSALFGIVALNAKSQSQVTIPSDISGKGKPLCSYTYDLSITFTLVDPVGCQTPVTVTVYPIYSPPTNFQGMTYTNTALGYPGYDIVSATVNTIIGSLTVGDYSAPLPCSITPFSNNVTIYDPGGCQYGAQWIYTGGTTAYLYLL